MFEQLTGRLQTTLRKLRGSAKIDEKSFAEAARELRLALLEADVHFGVVKDFLTAVKAKALEEKVARSLTPGQQVIKIVNEELVSVLGGPSRNLRFSGAAPHVVLIVGLQGAGKTTTVGKLGAWFRREGRSPLLVSVDVHRPAAREQLARFGETADLFVHESSSDDVVQRATEAVGEARRRGDDIVLVDTAGRLHIDDAMMREVQAVAAAVQPERILYVCDSMVGQDAVQAATAFATALAVDGHILTKLDGDARGGAALSIAAVTGLPIYFAGVGEKIDDLEVFHPDRIASRILGMGDVLTLIEKVQDQVDLEATEELEKRARQGELTLEDFKSQLRQIRRMGSMSKLLEFLPGASNAPGLAQMAPDDAELRRIEAIIDSMTRVERHKPRIINGSRRKRIAAGSGTSVQEVNRLLKRFAQSRKLMKKLNKKGRRDAPWANLPSF